MNSKPVLLSIFFFVLLRRLAFAQDRTNCKIIKIVDGDTFYCNTVSGPEKIRLIGVNTPEMKTPEGIKARDFASSIISVNQVVKLELDVQIRGHYKRLMV